MLRGRLLTVHRWLALLAFLPLSIVLISGAALSFVNEFDRAMHPALLSVAASKALSIEQISSIIDTELVTIEADLVAIRYPDSPYDPIGLQLSMQGKQWSRYLNPHSGKLLGERNVTNDWNAQVLKLHIHLLETGYGSAVTLIGTVVLIVMLGLGVLLLKRGSAWRISGWHAWLGLCSAPVLLMISISGLIAISGVASISGSDRVKPVILSSSVDLIQLRHAELISKCSERPTELVALTSGGVRLTCNTGNTWLFEQGVGGVSAQESSSTQTLLWDIHSGEWAGLPGRAIWMWSVLGVLYLIYSGLRDWYQKLRGSRT